jgi:hypothetical protein
MSAFDKYKKMNWDHEYAENGIINETDFDAAIKIELSNLAYQKDKAKQERDKAEKELIQYKAKIKYEIECLYMVEVLINEKQIDKFVIKKILLKSSDSQTTDNT